MLQYIFDFLGIEYSLVMTDELLSQVLPVLICVGAALSLYLFICFMQFIRCLILRKD